MPETQTTVNALDGSSIDAAAVLFKRGWEPIPVEAGCKRPMWSWSGVKHAALFPNGYDCAEAFAHVRRYRWFHTSTGLRCGRVIGLDNDLTGEPSLIIDRIALSHLGESHMRRLGSPAKLAGLRVYRYEGDPEGWQEYRVGLAIRDGRRLIRAGEVAFLGRGRQFVGYGWHEKAGRPYLWADDSGLGMPCEPLTVNVAELVPITDAQIKTYFRAVCRELHRLGFERTGGSRAGRDYWP